MIWREFDCDPGCNTRIFLIKYTFWNIVSLICRSFVSKLLGSMLVSRNIILTLFLERCPEYHPWTILESLMHLYAPYQLFANILFLTLGVLIITQMIESFLHLIIIWLFFAKGSGVLFCKTFRIFHAHWCTYNAFMPSFISELWGPACYPRIFVRILPAFGVILSVIWHYFTEKSLVASTLQPCNF